MVTNVNLQPDSKLQTFLLLLSMKDRKHLSPFKENILVSFGSILLIKLFLGYVLSKVESVESHSSLVPHDTLMFTKSQIGNFVHVCSKLANLFTHIA